MFLHVVWAAQSRAALYSPIVDDWHAATARDLARRRFAATWLPRLVVRFTYRGAAADSALSRDDAVELWRWPIALGATLEFRAVWGFDLLAAGARREPALPPSRRGWFGEPSTPSSSARDTDADDPHAEHPAADPLSATPEPEDP